MTPELWAVNVGAIVAAATAAGVGAWVKHGLSRVEGKVEDAASSADEAARKVEPVSNGFASRTTTTLDEIKTLVMDVRSEQARLAERVDRIDAGWVAHLEMHARGSHGPE